MSNEPVGLVIGTEDAYALDFWVWVYPHRYLQLDDVVDLIPSPAERGAAAGQDPARKTEVSREPSPAAPVSAFVFKTVADPHAGRISLFRVYSGTLKSDSTVLNATRDASERLGALELLQGKTPTPVPEIQAGDLGAVAKSAALDLRLREPGRAVTLKIAEGGIVSGDPKLLRVVMDNLIGNAWKYSGKRADAVIEFGMRDQGKETVYFVRDNGVGFDMAYADKLFAAFERLHDSEEFEGIGIGLVTVQRIIQRHGGRIWAEGEAGKGATFYFTLG